MFLYLSISEGHKFIRKWSWITCYCIKCHLFLKKSDHVFLCYLTLKLHVYIHVHVYTWLYFIFQMWSNWQKTTVQYWISIKLNWNWTIITSFYFNIPSSSHILHTVIVTLSGSHLVHIPSITRNQTMKLLFATY